jgi:hypothetical protein
MTTAVGNQNRSVHAAVTDLCVLYLEQSGFAGVAAKPYREKISDALGDDDLAQSDVRGLHGVHLDVRSRLRHRLDVDMDRARVGADINRQPVAAFVQWRGSRPVSDSYVVMDFRSFVALLGGTPPP